MSSLPVAEVESFLIANYCDMIATSLILYDHVFTTKEEIRLFWGKKLTGATVLFWLNKWLVIVGYTLTPVLFFKLSEASCVAFVKFALIVQVAMYLVWGLFTALRTYALCRNRFLAAAIFLLYVVSAGLNMCHFTFGLTGVNIPTINCVELDSTPTELVKMFTTISRTCLILANCLAIGVTWSTVRRDRGFSYVRESRKKTLAGVLLWDGFIYFVTLAIMDSLHMTITLLSISQFITNNVSFITIFSDPLTAILMSHFMLHLQYAAQRTTETGSSQESASNTGTLTFERAFGSLGASISPEDYFANEEGRGDDSVESSLSSDADARVDNLAE